MMIENFLVSSYILRFIKGMYLYICVYLKECVSFYGNTSVSSRPPLTELYCHLRLINIH